MSQQLQIQHAIIEHGLWNGRYHGHDVQLQRVGMPQNGLAICVSVGVGQGRGKPRKYIERYARHVTEALEMVAREWWRK